MKRYKIRYFTLKDGSAYWKLFTNPWSKGTFVCKSKMFANLEQAKKSARGVCIGRPHIVEYVRSTKIVG